jgi:23S rRNA pseudouridine2605 synthase
MARADGPLTHAKLFRILQVQAGVSRRKAQELIASGEVSLDGVVITDPYHVLREEEGRSLRLRGHPISLAAPEYRVYRFHKPTGMLCSHDDPHYGDTLGRVLRAEGFIGYTWAGRLDQDAEGLLLISNDGRLVHRLTHPRYEVEKRYLVWVTPTPSMAEMNRIIVGMKRGISDAGEALYAADASRLSGRGPVEVVLTEGKKHELKRLFAHFGLTVTRLRRTAIGPVALGSLDVGRFDRVTGEEAAALSALRKRSQD